VLDPLWKGKQFRTLLYGGLEKFCDKTPADQEAARCHKALHEYGPQAIEYVARRIHPQKVCEKVELCTDVDKETRDSSAKCEGCKLGVGILDSMLKSIEVQQDLVALLDDHACSALKDVNQREECQFIVKSYGPAMLNALAELLGPQLLCVETGACSKE
jgi:hypothetical protein